jgi:hypothetical protein
VNPEKRGLPWRRSPPRRPRGFTLRGASNLLRAGRPPRPYRPRRCFPVNCFERTVWPSGSVPELSVAGLMSDGSRGASRSRSRSGRWACGGRAGRLRGLRRSSCDPGRGSREVHPQRLTPDQGSKPGTGSPRSRDHEALSLFRAEGPALDALAGR